MTLTQLRKLLGALDLKPSRKLGQNFLVDHNTILKICNASDAQAGDLVVEIGPGTGAMTEHLLDRGVELVAIEYDLRLADFLSERYGERDNFTLIQADAGRVDFDALTKSREWRCNANLPYSVSTVILAKLLAVETPPKSMTLLLQKEMADRIASPHGNKTYGALSVRTQAQYAVKTVGTVPPTVFYPPPEVQSAILRLDLREDRLPKDDFIRFDAFVKHCFSQRRKKLRKRLLTLNLDTDVDQGLEATGISPDLRPEALTVKDFLALFRALYG
jgi:16S rRNA (adenine1518-N6/adenine1519-N6)-dimethyltransferase